MTPEMFRNLCDIHSLVCEVIEHPEGRGVIHGYTEFIARPLPSSVVSQRYYSDNNMYTDKMIIADLGYVASVWREWFDRMDRMDRL
jgi:hypothetical protein